VSSPLLDPRLHLDNLGVIYARGTVPGHGLRAGGEPYLVGDCYLDRCSTNVRGTVHQENGGVRSVAGVGHAVCQCGVLSPHVNYGRDRRAWHRQHKARVILGYPEPPTQPAPVNPQEIA
jgi:hypothetical protein